MYFLFFPTCFVPPEFLAVDFRSKNDSSSWSFWINSVNKQPAATEISNESMLEPIFESAGKNAHMPTGIILHATAHALCKPYVQHSANVCTCAASFYLLLALALGSLLICRSWSGERILYKMPNSPRAVLTLWPFEAPFCKLSNLFQQDVIVLWWFLLVILFNLQRSGENK